MTTKKKIRFTYVFLLVLVLSIFLVMPAFAISESDVQAQVDSVGRETVTSNVLIWFLCAVGFLKAAQKIDSFMASLGVNVGHTGGSMMAEALIAARGVGSVAGAMGHSLGTAGSHRSVRSAAASASGFFKGGLIGMAKRRATGEAVRSATSSTSAVHAHHAASNTAAVHSCQATSTTEKTAHVATTVSSAKPVSQEVHTSASQTMQHTAASSQTVTHTNQTASATVHSQRHTASSFQGVGLGGAIFAKSLMKGGDFANDVISTVARGDLRSTGSITGDLATQSLKSYMGYTALGDGAAKEVPTFSNVEIGGGRITGMEIAPGSSEGVAFGMYLADQYTEPRGDFTKVHSADGALWYKQYAQDTVERKPYNAPDGTVAYQESIIKRLPDPPKRKERL